MNSFEISFYYKGIDYTANIRKQVPTPPYSAEYYIEKTDPAMHRIPTFIKFSEENHIQTLGGDLNNDLSATEIITNAIAKYCTDNDLPFTS